MTTSELGFGGAAPLGRSRPPGRLRKNLGAGLARGPAAAQGGRPTTKTYLVIPILLLAAAGCRKTPADAAALEKQFQESLSDVVLTGHFTLGKDDQLREEKYTIEKVSKIKGDLWLFQARIQYGSRDVTLPLPLRVEWAGDTPVITLTDLAIPGVGTYTARVLIYRGQYAGTWAGKGHGGHLFGRIVKKGE